MIDSAESHGQIDRLVVIRVYPFSEFYIRSAIRTISKLEGPGDLRLGLRLYTCPCMDVLALC